MLTPYFFWAVLLASGIAVFVIGLLMLGIAVAIRREVILARRVRAVVDDLEQRSELERQWEAS